MVGIALLGTAVVAGPWADAHHAVVTVDGTVLDRTELRARMTLDAELLGGREAVLRTAKTAGTISQEDADRIAGLLAEASADPLRAAVDGLVADELIRAEARSLGIVTRADVGDELRRSVVALMDRRVRLVTIAEPFSDAVASNGDWPHPDSWADPMEVARARAAAGTRASAELAAGTPIEEVAEGLGDAGWRTVARDQWLPGEGSVAGVPDGLVSAMRRAEPDGPPLVVEDGLTGTTALGYRLDASVDGTTAADTIDQGGIDGSALRRWAEARAAERAIRERFASTWMSEPTARIRVAELVIGPADLEGPPGPYRSFAHIVVRGLGAPIRQPDETDEALASRLATELQALTPDERERRFGALISAANVTPSADPLARSGELGYFTKDQIMSEIADRAFADDADRASIIGPVTTIVGPELFLLRAWFDGTLDERANAALVEARTTSDIAALARRIAPTGEAERADGTLWRAEDEFIGIDVVRRAYADTLIGGRSDPIVLDGEIIIVAPLERSIEPAQPAELDRLLVRGFDAWLASRTAEAAIIRDREPLPGLVVEASPTPIPSAGESATPPSFAVPPSAPPASPRPFPLATPRVIP